MSHRRNLGERPGLDEYLARFPESRSIVEGVFASQTIRDAPPSSGPEKEGRRGTTRELLVGILALQNGFIGHVALIRAIQAWARDKRRPLGSLLIEKGELDPARLALLNALADEQFIRYGGDLRTSLASFGSLAPVPQVVKEMGDPDVEAGLAGEAGSGPAPEATVFQPRGDDPPLFADGPSGSSASRFQNLRFYRAGGLGKVFNALDHELNRRVAFKEIKDPYVQEARSRDQFMLEGLVTGGLEHPGIVPVHSLGRCDDGRPYYAMRFIQGPSLKDKLGLLHDRATDAEPERAEDPPTLPRLLRDFVNACHAAAYAPSRGVLHRDLKPDHVMLGPFAETLVVDWGLAVPILKSGERGPAPEETLHLPREFESLLGHDRMIIGTPAYMSPEQAQGLPSRLDRTSDVYCLGGVLYSILTGEAPFRGRDFSTVIEKARAGDFPPPGRSRRTRRGPLRRSA